MLGHGFCMIQGTTLLSSGEMFSADALSNQVKDCTDYAVLNLYVAGRLCSKKYTYLLSSEKNASLLFSHSWQVLNSWLVGNRASNSIKCFWEHIILSELGELQRCLPTSAILRFCVNFPQLSWNTLLYFYCLFKLVSFPYFEALVPF